jgi:hypothetical protein
MESDDEQRDDAELLPPREVMSLINTDPSAYAGLLGDPTAATPGATGTADPAGGAADAAGSAAGDAHNLADAQASSTGGETVSDQPQTITTDSTQTASSET